MSEKNIHIFIHRNCLNILNIFIKYLRKVYNYSDQAYRKTGVSRHHGGILKATPETPPISRQYGTGGLKESPHFGIHHAERDQQLT